MTINAKAAIDSNRYADPIKTNGRWVEQAKPGPAGISATSDGTANIARNRQRPAGVPGRLERRRQRDVLLSAYS